MRSRLGVSERVREVGARIPGSHRGLGRCAPSAPAFWAAVTPMRPGGPASHHRRGHSWVDWKGCDHADGTPAACLVRRERRPHRAPRGSPVAPLCAARRGAGWWLQHNDVPGPPMGRGLPLALVGFGHGSTPGWADIVGWASSLPVRDVEVGWAFPRECGEVGTGGIPGRHRGLGRCAPSAPAFWSAVTPMRPGGPASHHRRGRSWVDWKGCDHADGTPAACLVAGRADRIALPEGAR